MIYQRIHNYKIISLLGEGGMANVYLVEHETLGHKYALKLLKEEFVQHANIRKRFLAEAKNLAKMQHPNVIKVTDLIDAGDIVAFVMEYIEGVSLEEYISQNAPLKNETIQSLFNQMIDAVEYVHSQDLIHRDIKPCNFMVTPQGAIKLLDFGIAKNLNDNLVDYTRTSLAQQMGTPMYMSPEQVRNSTEITKQTDIYSLGVVLWQMVSGQKPYSSESLSAFDLQLMIVQEVLPLTNTHWDLIIQKATQKDSSLRYKSCDFWQSEIENLTGRNNSQSNKTKIDNASNFRNVNSLTNSQKAKYAANSKQDKKERKSYFNLKTVSIGIGILLFIGILIIFNFSKDGAGDKSVATIPDNEKPEINVPSEKVEEPITEKVEPVTAESETLPKEKQVEVEKTTSIATSSKLKIGQKYQGGIIFYLDNSGKHGKVCSESDIGRFDWGSAIKECQNLNLNGYSDWYLPTMNDLKLLYTQKQIIPSLSRYEDSFWSSTETESASFVYTIYFNGSGYSDHNYKTNTFFALGVRYF
jgi:serine/threonine protein kinase